MSRDKQWYELPRPAAMKNLIEVRDELRAKNLVDTEEPKLAEQPGTADRGAEGRPHHGRLLQRSEVPDDGRDRRTVRP